MLGKAKIYVSNSIYCLKQKAITKIKNADGMEMLQMVLIIGVAVVIAGGMLVFLKTFMPTFWGNISAKMNAIFGAENSLGATGGGGTPAIP